MTLSTEKVQRLILKNYRHHEFYGYQLQKDLSETGLEIDMTRLYRILKEMNKADLLQIRWVNSSEGPRKKMYKLSEKGLTEVNKLLLEAIGTVHSFYGDYLLSLRDKIDVFDKILDPVSEKLTQVNNLGFLFKKYTPLNGLYFAKTRNKFKATYYCIKPKGSVSEEYPENVTAITGDYNNIPLKDNYLDCLILVDFPDEVILNSSILEWSRVLKKDGVLSLLTPSILLKRNHDPMSIGEFVEKTEHTIIEQGIVIDRTQLVDALANYFTNIEFHNQVHISTITCNNMFG